MFCEAKTVSEPDLFVLNFYETTSEHLRVSILCSHLHFKVLVNFKSQMSRDCKEKFLSHLLAKSPNHHSPMVAQWLHNIVLLSLQVTYE